MSQRLKTLTPFLSVLLVTTCLTSCGEDPELVRKFEQQKAEIMGLEGDLSLLREKLKNAPKDRSSELAELKAKTATEKDKIATLEESITSLAAEKRDLEKQLKDYQRQYPVR